MYAKRKALETQTAVKDEVSQRLYVDSTETRTCQKCADLDSVVESIQEKCSISKLQSYYGLLFRPL